MAPSDWTSRHSNDDRWWYGRAAMIGAAITCLLGLQTASSFITTSPQQPRRTSGSRARTPTHQRAILLTPRRSVPVAAQSQQSSAAQASNPALLDPLVETNTRKRVRSVQEAKTELLARVGYPASEPGAERPRLEEERVGYLVEVLQGTYKPIQTVGFFNFAAQGEWDLAYTNAAMVPIGPRLTADGQFQRVEPGEGLQGNLTNLLTWTLLDEGIDGRLEVECDYVFDARGWMNVSLRRHRLLPNQMPRDPKDLAVLLQRAMPHEFWDPNGHAMETTFLDDTMRIVKVRGPKFEGRVNIFVRRATSEDAEVDEEQLEVKLEEWDMEDWEDDDPSLIG